jgi:uncharacterized protein YegP (UPF0339 family)
MDNVEIYQRRTKVSRKLQWRWRYIAAGNYEVLASSSEGYDNYSDCVAAVQRVLAIPFSTGNVRRPTGEPGHWRVTRGDGSELLIVVSSA